MEAPPEISLPKSEKRQLKSLYFILWLAVGAYFPYINIYFRALGLSGTQIGLIATTSSLVGAGSALLWSMLNDRWRLPRRIFTITCLGTTAGALLLSQVKSLGLILVAAAVLTFFSSANLPLLDSLTIRKLSGRAEEYGHYRSWGTIGFITTSAPVGFIIERLGYKVIFLAYASVMLLFLAMIYRLGDQPAPIKRSSSGGLWQAVRQPHWLAFMASIFLLWISAQGGLAFIGVTVKDMGGTARLVGMAVTVAALVEVPFFFNGAWLINRIGVQRLTALAFLGYALRLLFYSLMPVPGWVVAINLMQSVSYVPFLIGSVAYLNQMATDETRSTAQGLFFAIMNLANVTGSLLSGWIYDHLGPNGLYRILAVTCLVGLGIFISGNAKRGEKSFITESTESVVES